MFMPYDNYMRPPPPPPMLPPPPPFHHSRYSGPSGGPTIVELEPSELGGANGSYIGTGRQNSFAPTDSPKSLGRGRIYNRRLGSRTYLVDETSEITTKSETPKTRPWKEVNDDVSARMMAASSDSPPLIPKKDYDDFALSPPFRSKGQQQPQPGSQPGSESGSDGARETDPVLNGQMTLYRGAARNPYETFMQPEPIYAYGRMPMMAPNPNIPYMGPQPPPPQQMMSFNGRPPRMVPPHPSMLLTDECMPPPPPPETFMHHPMGFGPPMMPMPMDFELFTFDEQKRKKSKNKLKKYRSLECISFPPPMMPPPMFFPPPMGMMPPPPPPPAFVMHPPPPPPDMLMPPMMMSPDGYHMMNHNHQLALPAPNSPQQMSYHQVTLNRNSTLNGLNQKIPMNDETMKSSKGMMTKNDSEKMKSKSSCYRMCCQSATLIVWIIIGIIIAGLVLGLTLGLTIV